MPAAKLFHAPEVLSPCIVLQNLLHPFPDVSPFAVPAGDDEDLPVTKKRIQDRENEIIPEIAVERIQDNDTVPVAEIRYRPDYVNVKSAVRGIEVPVEFTDSPFRLIVGPRHGFDEIRRAFPAAEFIICLREKQCSREHILQEFLQAKIGADPLG